MTPGADDFNKQRLDAMAAPDPVAAMAALIDETITAAANKALANADPWNPHGIPCPGIKCVSFTQTIQRP